MARTRGVARPWTQQPQGQSPARSGWPVVWNFGTGVPGLSDYPPNEAGPAGIGALVTTSYAGFTSGAIVPGLTDSLTAVMLVEPLSTTFANNFLFGEASPATGPYNYGFYETGAGDLGFFVHNGGSGVFANSGTSLSAIRRPVCVVATYDGATISVYRDGELLGTAAQSGNIQRDTSATLSYAVWNGLSSLHARIYGAAVSPRCLSASEVRQQLGSVDTAWRTLVAPNQRRIPVLDTGGAPVNGNSTGTFDFTGAATGTIASTVTGGSTGTFDLTGTATGTIANPGGSPVNGSSTGTFDLTGTATGTIAATVTGNSTGTFDLTGIATGTIVPLSTVTGSSTGIFNLTGSSTGAITNPDSPVGSSGGGGGFKLYYEDSVDWNARKFKELLNSKKHINERLDEELILELVLGLVVTGVL